MSCLSILARPFRRNSGHSEGDSGHSDGRVREGQLASNLRQFTSDDWHSHPCCSFAPLYPDVSLAPPTYLASDSDERWLGPFGQESDEKIPPFMTDVVNSMDETIKQLDADLRKLSLDMWHHPEIMWQERHTHDLFASYLEKQEGWVVTRHAGGLETAYSATFEHRPSQFSGKARTIGFNSEMDALPGIGHACGHNLIAISGVAASLAVAKALKSLDQPGKVILLGTPAEEGGGGKLVLLNKGLYKEMDACLMVHPAPTSMVGPWLAVASLTVNFTGKTAHAGAAPWEGVNALDAAVLAYNSISVLRQQLHPSTRVHGVLSGRDWAANVIPGNSTMLYNVRAPTMTELKALCPRVENCFRAAAQATGCDIEVKWGYTYADVQNSSVLTASYTKFMKSRFDIDVSPMPFQASSDFGDVTYKLPSLQPAYAIHLENPSTSGNHTKGFADAAKTLEAHERTKEAALGIAAIGARVLWDEKYAHTVRKRWEEDMRKLKK